jgi:RNA polymerase sigma factor (sigma-70 family)
VSDFGAFYAEHFAPAARLAFLLTRDSAGAEDIAQEALSRMQAGFEQIRSPSAYLRTVIVNLCRRTARDHARQRTTRERLGVPESPSDAPLELIDVIDRLPRRQKVVVVLRYYEDMTEVEIADALRCRPGTVKSLSARALATLRRELER